MTGKRLMHFHLEDPLRQSAMAGRHNFINLISNVLRRAGYEIDFRDLSEADPAFEGHSLTHMAQPPNARGLTFRRVYHYPFWQIETVAQRWHWDVARARFDPDAVPADAARFYGFWQKRLFGSAAAEARRDGFVYVPLQGHLRRQRVFQSCTPIEMLQHCLARVPDRRIVAGLHPKETYAPGDLAALEDLCRHHERLSVRTGGMEELLSGCDYVVTQNSGVAFSGFFFGKPALLFGQIDFHHIAIKADHAALDDSFAAVARHRPAFDKYIWWFWQEQSINAGRAEAEDRIRARLVRFGWPMD